MTFGWRGFSIIQHAFPVGGSGSPFATVVNSVVDPHWLQCGSRAGSSFYIIADLDPRELNPDPQKTKNMSILNLKKYIL
jgi:hypothetical protein